MSVGLWLARVLRYRGCDILSPEDRKRMREASARARLRLQAAGTLDIERDAQREIRARVRAGRAK